MTHAGLLLPLLLVVGLVLTATNLLPAPVVAAEGPAPGVGVQHIIDTHNHLFGRFPAGPGQTVVDYEGAAQVALETMDKLGIKKLFIMPPPFAPGHPHTYDVDELIAIVTKRPDRFALLGGGRNAESHDSPSRPGREGRPRRAGAIRAEGAGDPLLGCGGIRRDGRRAFLSRGPHPSI